MKDLRIIRRAPQLFLSSHHRLLNTDVIIGYRPEDLEVTIVFSNKNKYCVQLTSMEFVNFMKTSWLYFHITQDYTYQRLKLTESIDIRKTTRNNNYVVALRDQHLNKRCIQIFDRDDLFILNSLREAFDARVVSLNLYKPCVEKFKGWYDLECKKKEKTCLDWNEFKLNSELSFSIDFFRLFLEITSLANQKKSVETQTTN